MSHRAMSAPARAAWPNPGGHHSSSPAMSVSPSGARRCDAAVPEHQRLSGTLAAMRVAVVGHTEWIQFARVPHVPAAGDITQASRAWEDAGGGGGVSAVQLASLAGRATFFTALGAAELGRPPARGPGGLGLPAPAAGRDEPHRRGVTFVDDSGERTITLLGPKL